MACKPDDLNSIPRAHMVNGEKQLLPSCIESPLQVASSDIPILLFANSGVFKSHSVHAIVSHRVRLVT